MGLMVILMRDCVQLLIVCFFRLLCLTLYLTMYCRLKTLQSALFLDGDRCTRTGGDLTRDRQRVTRQCTLCTAQ